MVSRKAIVHNMMRGLGGYAFVVLALRGCPFSEQAATQFPRASRKVIWLSRAQQDVLDRVRHAFRHPTFPICLAVPLFRYTLAQMTVSQLQRRPPHLIKLGGMSDISECVAAAQG